MITSPPVAIVLTAIALVGGGCGGDAGTPAPTAARAPAALAGIPRDEAGVLAARGDYAAAERKYREALERQPDDFDLHYALACVLTQLDRRADAIEEFRWVVTNGRSGRPEVDSARRWLGGTKTTMPAASTINATKSPSPPPFRGESGAAGTVSGKLTWAGVPDDKSLAIRLIVEGSGGRKIVRSKLNASYTVKDLPAGIYKLTAAFGTLPIWKDLSVTVIAGEQTNLDLTPANAAVSPANFPVR